ncbi:YL1-domain-containing protein [Aspergillus campestris IBT 28561]|uniref:YL1-domain-containing protein n=1 Tax=Aspergillus campestris (strain IBT 28561) TaxID=1392248 RepID=A0A2I1CZB3_ASPC2|nr:YL1-domain-containing protein [Aspergillus campestris IBT 28561]PKY02963.1 YL1-domain-containing protein [Aspergillus campestris IBT 28561]
MADDPTDQSSSAEDAEPVESLIKGRSRRSTAGRHMSALLNAEADDDLALLFEEVDDDQEFDEIEAGGGEEDDMALDSSSDDDDQGPNARPDDDEGERQIEKEEKAEKKKRRAQEDLRFKIARKKVKIDPTAVPTAAPPPRPKKKSERISWIPTPDEGPTRSSSRRQTMHNKELTHARLKDSEEKRVRLIATMEEAAKRKAHLKPKEMTQAERLAEAERVERLNSKSLNLWEEMEKRKAEERKAKIEALQNRRLQGPVMSYWSGLATWSDGRLTRLGKVDITPKPEKEEPARKKSKKSEKEDKSVPGQPGIEGTGPGPSQTAPSASENPTVSTPAEGDSTKQGQEASQTQQPSEAQDAPKESGVSAGANTGPTVDGSAGSEKLVEVGTTTGSPQASKSTPNDAPNGDVQNPKSPKPEDAIMTEAPQPEAVPTDASKTDGVQEAHSPKPSDTPAEPAHESTPKPKDASTEPAQPAGSDATALKEGSVQNLDSHKSEKEGENITDRMDIDEEHKNEPAVTVDNEKPDTQETPKEPASEKEPVANAESQPKPTPEGDKTDDATKDAVPAPAAPTTEAPAPTAPAAPRNAETPTEPEKLSPGAAPDGTPAQSVPPGTTPAPTEGDKSPGTVTDPPTAAAEEAPPQPQIPAPPAVVEQAGRCLTVLEDFDEKTAQSREFSIYFNAKKPPRLTKISSSLCVITSLPSRYRHKETSLPFSNSYAYREIHNTVDQKYQWSPMLGCYVGPVGVAAKGVPARFLGGPKEEPKEGETETGEGESAGKESTGKEGDKKEGDTKSAGGAPASTPVVAGAAGASNGDPMVVDK